MAVAVFETHILRKAVTAITAATRWDIRGPTCRSANRAIRRSTPQRAIARASKNPPRKRKTISWA